MSTASSHLVGCVSTWLFFQTGLGEVTLSPKGMTLKSSLLFKTLAVHFFYMHQDAGMHGQCYCQQGELIL